MHREVHYLIILIFFVVVLFQKQLGLSLCSAFRESSWEMCCGLILRPDAKGQSLHITLGSQQREPLRPKPEVTLSQSSQSSRGESLRNHCGIVVHPLPYFVCEFRSDRSGKLEVCVLRILRQPSSPRREDLERSFNLRFLNLDIEASCAEDPDIMEIQPVRETDPWLRLLLTSSCQHVIRKHEQKAGNNMMTTNTW